jgi:HlyD family secretion protein
MKRVTIIAAILLLIAAGSAFLYFRLQPEPQPGQIVYGSGRIEADEVRIAPEVPGRLVENRRREGETVQAGELLARIDPVDFELVAGQASAQLAASRRSAAEIDAQAHLARHHVETSRGELARYETLRRKGWVTVPQLDTRRNAYMAATGQVSVLQQQRAQADAQSEVAARSLALARERLARTSIHAPLSGRVLERLAEPGEVVAAGQPVAIVANLSQVRLKLFVSEADLGRLRLGAPARIRVDAFPDRTFDARIARVDAQAQFTPRDVHMKDERVRTVYGVTLEAANPQGLLKPGMPADAWILWDQARGWPARLTVPE